MTDEDLKWLVERLAAVDSRTNPRFDRTDRALPVLKEWLAEMSPAPPEGIAMALAALIAPAQLAPPSPSEPASRPSAVVA
jgi:hypothetical protein